ncbi:hypothetical protein ABZ876_38515 [Streptomyces sp. NPDC046931]|uniref:hypothetical protein n=1 Tax=Streptomyces sp. NPDC046931 TaxID=3154806 RepID=UPI0033E4D1AE
MRTLLRRLTWRKKPTRTATEELLEEAKQQELEDDTDTSPGAGGGAGDPITPSLNANRNTAEGHPSGDGS